MRIEKPEEFATIMAEYDYRLAAGAHPEIQLSALLAQLGKLAKKQIGKYMGCLVVTIEFAQYVIVR